MPALVNDCDMLAPVPDDDPVTPPVATAVHAKVVPVTLDVNEILVLLPEHNVCAVGVAVTVGIGLTVITTVIGVPTQVLAVGVMV